MHFISKTAFSIRLLIAFCFILLLAACSTVRNYPANTPFVFSNKVTIKGNITKDERKRLTEDLNNYWDDSMKAIKVQQLGFRYILKNPPVFDTNNIFRSRNFMNAYLNSQGYYYASFTPSYHFTKARKDQIRTSIAFDIALGKSIRIDSVAYYMFDTTKQPLDSSLQKLTLLQLKKSLLKKGAPYTKDIINSELERLLNWYHQNGYYKFSKDHIFALIDTLDTKLLTLTLDPYKQAELIAAADKKKQENPYWNVTIMQRQGIDSSATQQFYVGNTYYYPELKDAYYNPDSVMKRTDFKSATNRGMTMYYKDGLFNFRPLREHTYLRRGNLFNDDLYYKTSNRLSQIGAWKQVDIRTMVRGKDSIDLYVFMVPEKKQSFTIDQELSRNTGDIGSGNLLGIATNFSYKNRNLWKQAVQSLTTLRFGVELNLDKTTDNASNSILQTTQVNLSHTLNFPRLIQPFKHWSALSKLDNKRTLLTIGGSYVDRKSLYRLNSFITNWGYEWSKGNNTWLFKPLNIELYKVDSLEGLNALFKTNPFLRNSFKNGKVAGISLSYSKTFGNKHDGSVSHYIRFGFEESGAIINQFTNLKNNVFEYNKMEGEYRFLKKYRKNELASRFFIGAGISANEQTLPVFKQYFLGGPNSMRAWGLRQLGLGSSLSSDTTTSGYTDRFGDFMMEANLEYRFPIGTIGGVKIGSALYTDIGNVWNINKDITDPNASFSLSRLNKDLAVGVGTGVRIDFSYFLIRVDFAYKLKDPARENNNGWMNPKEFVWTSERANGVRIKNYAFQLGIGLPF